MFQISLETPWNVYMIYLEVIIVRVTKVSEFILKFYSDRV